MFKRLDDQVIQPLWLDKIGRVQSFWSPQIPPQVIARASLFLNEPVQFVNALNAPDNYLFIGRGLELCDKWTLLRSMSGMTVRREDIFPVRLWKPPFASPDYMVKWMGVDFYGEDADWDRMVELFHNGVAMVGPHRCRITGKRSTVAKAKQDKVTPPPSPITTASPQPGNYPLALRPQAAVIGPLH